MIIRFAIIYLLLKATIILQGANPTGCIELNITNIRNNSGQVLISVFNQSIGFPSDGNKVYRYYVIETTYPTMLVLIEMLPPGDYAVAIVHDENRNLQLDTNILGAPVEGYAASGKNSRYSSPKFESSKFRVGYDTITKEIRMNYLF